MKSVPLFHKSVFDNLFSEVSFSSICSVRPQPAAAAVESSYHVNVSGGNVSIGDHSVTNVGTGTPRLGRLLK